MDLCLCSPRAVFLGSLEPRGGGGGKSEALVSKDTHARTPACLRCLDGIVVTQSAVNTHIHAHADLNKSRGTPAHSCANTMRRLGNTAWIDGDTLNPGRKGGEAKLGLVNGGAK